MNPQNSAVLSHIVLASLDYFIVYINTLTAKLIIKQGYFINNTGY